VLKIFIGYDETQPAAFHVCAESLITNSSRPLSITPLHRPQLHALSSPHAEGYPPSNTFNLTRFLVPHLCDFQGLALYIDGDMVVDADIAELFGLFEFRSLSRRENGSAPYALGVVQHDYRTNGATKFKGQVNRDYPRKNWSSVMLFDASHVANGLLRPQFVASKSAEYLHRLEWLDDSDIMELPKEWNVLADEPNQSPAPKLIHYTLGTPCFPEYAGCQYARIWHYMRRRMNYPAEL
jgi:hypothetical protein